jgi:hypothetical protein
LTARVLECIFSRIVVRIYRRQSDPAFQRSAWFTLILFVAYLVYVPIHLALDPHCVGGTVHVAVHDHDAISDHHHGHQHHDHDQEGGHHDHHPAELHDVAAVAKDDSLYLDLDPFLPGSQVICSEPVILPASLVRNAELIREFLPGRTLLPRAPPIA